MRRTCEGWKKSLIYVVSGESEQARAVCCAHISVEPFLTWAQQGGCCARVLPRAAGASSTGAACGQLMEHTRALANVLPGDCKRQLRGKKCAFWWWIGFGGMQTEKIKEPTGSKPSGLQRLTWQLQRIALILYNFALILCEIAKLCTEWLIGRIVCDCFNTMSYN